MSEEQRVTESIFDGKSVSIPMARVMFLEWSDPEHKHGFCVVLEGAKHPLDQNGNYINGYGRPDCPYLTGQEAQDFLKAWGWYRAEVDGVHSLAPNAIQAAKQ